MAKDLAIVLNNGSINSAVVTALAAQRYRPILLHIETTGETPRTRAAFEQQVGHFKPYREHALPLALGAGLQNRAIGSPADPRQTVPQGPQMVALLPLIALAVRFAAHYEAAAIYLGMRVGPAADELAQATEYIQIWNEMIQMPCARPDLSMQTPLMELEAWQVIDLGFQAAAPFERTWSCMEEGTEPCWACPPCRAREAAFLQAAKPDPMRTVRKV